MASKIIRLLDFKILALIIAVISIAISLLHYYWKPSPGSVDYTYHYTHYNNFLIFKYSFYHLIHHIDLYKEVYPGEGHYDLFKYSPAFALFMAPFAVLPTLPGLILWNLLNGLVLLYAFKKFPFKNETYKLLALCFIIIEVITSMESAQSNCLIAGMLILAYLAMEKKNMATASLLIIVTAFIKLFGAVALLLFLFFPNKLKAAGWTILWVVVLAILPIIVTGPSGLITVYHDWINCLNNDYSISWGFSVMGWLHTWFGINGKKIIMFIGLLLFLLPLLRISSFHSPLFRQLFLASSLLWVVLFNYKAESPTFIIAVSGIAIWFFSIEYKKINLILLLLAFLFTVLIATDLFPKDLRVHVLIPYVVKVVPCALIWLKLSYDLLTMNFVKSTITANN